MQKRHSDVFSMLSYRLPDAFPVSATLKTRVPFIGQYLPMPHLHNVLEVGYCHEGRGTFSIAQKLLPFAAGDVVVINQHEPHVAANSSGVGCIWSWLFFDVPKLLGVFGVSSDTLDTGRLCGNEFNNVMPSAKFPAESSIVRLIIDELESKRPGHENGVRGLVLTLVTLLHRIELPPGQAAPSPKGRELIQRLSPAIDLIRRSYATGISAADLAAKCSMSETYLRRSFRKALGRSPYEYLMEYRLSMACQELEDKKLTVEAIAAKHGFPTLSCFVRAFRKRKGLPPRQWARKAFGR